MSDFRFFEVSEFDCTHTGENRMEHGFIELLDELRLICEFPLVVTSGYRSPNHPIEKVKPVPGTHAQGIAADLQTVDSYRRYILLKNAFVLGFTGVGVGKDFIHLDTRGGKPRVWTY